ncbi:hypothetical protein B1L11_14135 [Microbispora sp. GKU 823]|nr:hypothetical protein B1L11_14135 [Microbispora sp. GKU 823]
MRTWPCYSPTSPGRYRALVGLAAGTALRWGECVGLRWDAVDLEAGTVRVEQVAGMVTHKPYPKSKAGRREVPLPLFVVELFAAHRERYPAGPVGEAFTNAAGGPPRRTFFRSQDCVAGVDEHVHPRETRNASGPWWVEAFVFPSQEVRHAVDQHGNLLPQGRSGGQLRVVLGGGPHWDLAAQDPRFVAIVFTVEFEPYRLVVVFLVPVLPAAHPQRRRSSPHLESAAVAVDEHDLRDGPRAVGPVYGWLELEGAPDMGGDLCLRRAPGKQRSASRLVVSDGDADAQLVELVWASEPDVEAGDVASLRGAGDGEARCALGMLATLLDGGDLLCGAVGAAGGEPGADRCCGRGACGDGVDDVGIHGIFRSRGHEVGLPARHVRRGEHPVANRDGCSILCLRGSGGHLEREDEWRFPALRRTSRGKPSMR